MEGTEGGLEERMKSYVEKMFMEMSASLNLKKKKTVEKTVEKRVRTGEDENFWTTEEMEVVAGGSSQGKQKTQKRKRRD